MGSREMVNRRTAINAKKMWAANMTCVAMVCFVGFLGVRMNVAHPFAFGLGAIALEPLIKRLFDMPLSLPRVVGSIAFGLTAIAFSVLGGSPP